MVFEMVMRLGSDLHSLLAFGQEFGTYGKERKCSNIAHNRFQYTDRQKVKKKLKIS